MFTTVVLVLYRGNETSLYIVCPGWIFSVPLYIYIRSIFLLLFYFEVLAFAIILFALTEENMFYYYKFVRFVLCALPR